MTEGWPSNESITKLAAHLYEIGLHSVGPDDLDNRQIAERLLARGAVGGLATTADDHKKRAIREKEKREARERMAARLEESTGLPVTLHEDVNDHFHRKLVVALAEQRAAIHSQYEAVAAHLIAASWQRIGTEAASALRDAADRIRRAAQDQP